jgi:preprotein translocase subunit SecG
MHLTHETAKATIIQFTVLAFLNIVDALQSILSTCFHSGSECVSNLLSSVIYYVLIVVWFGIILALGISAQETRNKSFVRALILAELAVIVVAGYNIKLDTNSTNHNGILSLLTSLVDVVIAIWVIRLSYRLSRAEGGRVVKRSRQRQRTRTGTKL